jgi:GDPmannose 4,6-dehydratase
MKSALITGITGQDGSYLAEFLLGKPDYVVHGLVRRSSSLNRQRIDPLFARIPGARERLHLHYADLADATSLSGVMDKVRPDEVYNLGAQSHVRVSFDQPLYTADVVGLGTLRLLEAVRQLNQIKPVRFYQASSSEMFGSAPPPQGLDTPFHPRSPYSCAKLYAHWQTINYREAYGLFACSGVLFNHESPRRGESFVTRKITLGATRIKEGLQRKLVMGNLDARRDWGFAGDYVRAMWMMLQQPQPDDYVVATGKTYSVRDFLEAAFSLLELDYRDFVEFDPRYTRPSEVDVLLGDATKARQVLGWEAEVDFPALVKMMVEHDWELARREKFVQSYPSH